MRWQKNKYIIGVFITAIVMSYLSSPLLGQIVHGRLFTSFYSWEREVFGTDQEKYLQMYSGAIVHVKEIYGNKDVSFHTYVRFGNTLAGDDLDIKQKLYNSYFEWKKIKDKLDVSFGRQFIWAGVGNGTLDGGKVDFLFPGGDKIGFYIGTLAPLKESWKIDSWTSSHMIGAYYKARYYDTNMQLSWVRKNREPVSYKVPGKFTGRIVKTSSLIAHLAGIDLSRNFTDKLKLFLRTEATVERDKESLLGNTLDFDRFELSADYEYNDNLTLSGQYFYRNPRQNLNSIFSIFSQSNNQEFWLNAYYNWSGYSFFGGIAVVDFDGESSQRFNVGVGNKYASTGYNKNLGYSGDLDNFYIGGRYPYKNKLWLKGNLAIGRYKLFEDAVDYNNLVTSSAGITFKPRQTISIDLDVQGLQNELTDNDIRLFGRFTYWFFQRNLFKRN